MVEIDRGEPLRIARLPRGLLGGLQFPAALPATAPAGRATVPTSAASIRPELLRIMGKGKRDPERARMPQICNMFWLTSDTCPIEADRPALVAMRIAAARTCRDHAGTPSRRVME